jgi:signal transduction protein with GAF and PtsI domain
MKGLQGSRRRSANSMSRSKTGLDRNKEARDKQDLADAESFVAMPRWIAKKLALGESIDERVLAIVEHIRNRAKAPQNLDYTALKQLLSKKERKINVKVSLSAEECKPEYSRLFTGVGLIRGEYQLRKNMMWITMPEMQRIEKDYVEKVLKIFAGKDVWYRTIEVPTSWVNVFDGGDHIIDENDTVIGLRGIRRALAFPEAFLLELELLADLSKRYSNLHIVFPYVHDVSELRDAKAYLKQVGFRGKVGIMAEIPSTILCLERFIEEGVDSIVIGLNDLTSLTLGSLRDLPIFSNTHPSVVKMMTMAIEKTRGSTVEMVVAGRHNPKSVETAEKLGFDACTIFVSDLSAALT